ncbi:MULTISPECIES: amino acid ABC transporter ATP-binding protein [Gluconobacter]|uniref:Amino acid ABC transporter ATPase n=1 Tax=Gluconobacter cerinus TaxID=38307 RepID=A0AAV5NEB5_9PROT|nr:MULTISPECIES: amino acid ABC transporter ATP-binding protein [Gluconobacter]MCW2264875.1 polar amino acid transport system ATP-binding protein [Gluconobacter cerinus]GBR05106.1 amino acid transporter ATP-binding protein [Gluconobacter cerinus NRIC 0229]GLQ62289.1 amino acid ABC transporter ATPase [Gluconobacter cerinus]
MITRLVKGCLELTDLVLQASGIAKSFDGNEILRGLSLDVERGELISIIGPSGCGKSTFLRCLNFLEHPDAGTVRIEDVTLACTGKSWTRANEAQAHRLRAHVGMVFQAFNLFPHRTVIDNVMMAPMRVKGVSRDEAQATACTLLEKVGLAGVKDRYPDSLSGGQKQRAAIARALAMKPSVMLYDEPTSALDPELSEEVLSVMRDLDDDGMTQLVVTHDMRFARAASDRVLYVEAGEIVESGDPDLMFANPKEGRTRRFLRTLL